MRQRDHDERRGHRDECPGDARACGGPLRPYGGAFQSQIRLSRGTQTVDGKSIMGVLLLAAARGTMLEITADGPDEIKAVAALVQLIESGLGE